MSQANTPSRHRSFSVGEPVYMRNFGSGPRWIPGTIRLSIGNVSYDVALDEGRCFRHHIDHIQERSISTDLPIRSDSESVDSREESTSNLTPP